MSRAHHHQVLIWKDIVHERIENTRLSIWRLGFGPRYQRDKILAALRAFYEETGITAHVAYETLGDFDLLLRLWIPRTYLPEDIELEMRQALEDCDLYGITYIACHTDMHHGDDEDEEFDAKAALDLVRSLDDDEVQAISEYNESQAPIRLLIDEIHREARDETDLPEVPCPPKVDELLAARALVSIPLDKRGVRFFVIFDHPRQPFRPITRERARERLHTTCEEVKLRWKEKGPDFEPQVSIYTGSGTMGDFIVMARAPHGRFHAFVRELVIRIREIDLFHTSEMRPYTHVIADRLFSDFREARRLPDAPEPVDEATVQSDEDEALEFKAALRENVRSFVVYDRYEPSPARVDDVVKAVCGLLNSPRPGRLVIGVLEVRREIAKREDPLAYLNRLKEKFGYRYDPDDVPNVPNAVIGIEHELRPDAFSDRDVYLGFLKDTLLTHLRPRPFPYVRIDFPLIGDRVVCVVSTRPADTWFEARVGKHKQWTFFARTGASSHALEGTERLLYQQAHPRGRE